MTIAERIRALPPGLLRPDGGDFARPTRFWASVWQWGALPTAIFVTFVVFAFYGGVHAPTFAFPVGIGTAAPVLLIRRRALLAWALTTFLALWFGTQIHVPGAPDATWPWNPVQTLIMLACGLVLTLRHRTRVAALAWALTMAVIISTVRATPNIPAMCLLFTLPFLLGAGVRAYARQRRRLAVETEKGGVLTERARIARELHDVVAHHMSMIAVRAETAPYRLPEVGAEEKAEFTAISAAARGALTEMRLLLGVLRSDDAAVPPTAPQPTLGDLPELVDAARHAGTVVAADLPEPPPQVPPIVAVSAYRIVQEALSNAARHAPGGSVAVLVSVEDGDLDVFVVNEPGTRPAAGGGGGGGYGLRGAAERAAVLGGSLESGPTPGGGFRVHARLPMTEEHP